MNSGRTGISTIRSSPRSRCRHRRARGGRRQEPRLGHAGRLDQLWPGPRRLCRGLLPPGDDHGVGGVGPAQLYYDSEDGRPIGQRLPWVGTTADIFVQAQFPMHSGRILGYPAAS